MKLLSRDTTVLIATFSPWKAGKRLPINGNLEPLLDFFVTKVKKTVLIDQVYPGSDFVMPRNEIYEKGRDRRICSVSPWMYVFYPWLKLTNVEGTQIAFKLRDFFAVIDWCRRDKSVWDLYIGLESINGLAGILLKKLGYIKRVVYYVSDYSPKRYPQPWFNALYVWLDRYCAQHADYVWDVSPAIHPARIKAGLNPAACAPVLHVPNALYPAQIRPAPLSAVKPFSLVFMGTLSEINGPDLAVAALPLILKQFPKTRLHIIGGGINDLARLKNLVASLHLERRVVFHGFIGERKKVSQMIRRFMVALAPYVAVTGSARWYGDATKIRAYLAAGLPTVTTRVPPLGKEAAGKGAAIVVSDRPEEIARAVMKLFSARKLYLRMRKKALEFARDNTWENEFSKALQQMAD